jgi:hypothetical protein
MDLTVIIQVAIGIIFVWIILAVITSQIQEWVSSIFVWRANMLEATILQMLGDPDLTKKVYSHPLIQGLYSNNGKRKPAGIPEDKFALVLFEQIMNADQTAAEVKDTFERIKQNVAKLKTAEKHELQNFAISLDTLLIGVEQKTDDATRAITEARVRVEGWFNNSMERLGGAFRRRMQIIAIITGITVSVVLNVDTAAIVNALWKDPVVRQAVVAQSNQALIANQQSTQTPEPNQTPLPNQTPAPNTQTSQTPDVKEIAKNIESLSELSLPIGWSFKVADQDPETPDDPRAFPSSFGGWVVKIVGLLLSGMAAAQGAPYWFDLMRKLVTRNPPVPPTPS